MKNESKRYNLRELIGWAIFVGTNILNILDNVFYTGNEGYIITATAILYVVAIILLLPALKRDLKKF